jgi:hypothetical protein
MLVAIADVSVGTGGAAGLAAQVVEWSAAGFDGVRFLPRDLPELVETLLPALRQGGLGARGGTLRERLGLPPAINRYATAA